MCIYDQPRPLSPGVMEFEEAIRALPSSSLEKMTQKDFERWGLTAMKLHAHQLEGVRWLAERHQAGHGCILGDEMGLGKTLQVSEQREVIITIIALLFPASLCPCCCIWRVSSVSMGLF